VCHGDQLARRAIVMQHKTQRPVQFEITQATRDALQAWNWRSPNRPRSDRLKELLPRPAVGAAVVERLLSGIRPRSHCRPEAGRGDGQLCRITSNTTRWTPQGDFGACRPSRAICGFSVH
jgi:hypothetical protein